MQDHVLKAEPTGRRGSQPGDGLEGELEVRGGGDSVSGRPATQLSSSTVCQAQ